MAITVNLTQEEETRLRNEAERQGVPAEDLVLNAVRKLLPPARNVAAIRALEEVYDDGDEEEQRETWEYLKRVLDEDRLSYRKLFP